VPASNQDDRIVRGRDIELGRERQALLRELRLVPVAVADNDGARLRILGGAADDREQFVERAGLGEIDARAAADAVQMSIGKTWRHEAAAKVDDLGGRARMSAHGLGGAGRDETPILDCEGFDQRRACIRREHLAVENHEVGGLRGSGGHERKRNDRTGQIRNKSAEPQAHERYSPRNIELRREVAAL